MATGLDTGTDNRPHGMKVSTTWGLGVLLFAIIGFLIGYKISGKNASSSFIAAAMGAIGWISAFSFAYYQSTGEWHLFPKWQTSTSDTGK